MLQWLNKLSSTSKRTEKEAILTDLSKSPDLPLFSKVVVYALSNEYDYGVKQFKKSTTHAGIKTIDNAFELLDKLRARDLSGGAAKTAVSDMHRDLDHDSAEVFARIIAHNLKCGVGPETFNKCLGDIMYVHPYRKCKSFSAASLKKIKLPAISQIKEDGAYNDIYVTADGVTGKSRAGLDIEYQLPPHLNAQLKTYAQGYVLMGEARVWSEDRTRLLPREEGNGLLSKSADYQDRVVMIFWDCVPIEEHAVGKKSSATDIDRFNKLVEIMNRVNSVQNDQIRVVDTRIVNTVQDIIDHFKHAVELGEEGTVVKNFDGHWEHGECADTIKIKIIFDCDLVIDGVEEGTGKNEGRLGALTLRSADNKLRVNVGIGFSDEQRIAFWEAQDKLIGRVCTVKANEVLSKGNVSSLFLPRFNDSLKFVEIRDDKRMGDSLDRVIEQRNAVYDIIQSMVSDIQ